MATSRRSFVLGLLAAAALIVTTLAAIGGWLHTVRELNRLTAYQVVGAEALRLARSARAGANASLEGLNRIGELVRAEKAPALEINVKR